MGSPGKVLLAGAVAVATAGAGCSRDWDRYEPVVTGSGGTGGTGVGGSAGGGGVGGDGGQAGSPGGGGAGAAETCGTLAVLAENFDGPALGLEMSRNSWSGYSTAVAGGEGVVVVPSPATSGWGGFRSRRYLDLRDHRFWLEVTTMVDVATTANVTLWVERDGDNGASIRQSAGTLRIGALIGGGWTPITQLPYDPVAHRWWAVREQAGTFYFETSPDGQSFTAQHSVPVAALFPIDSLSFEFGASAEGGETDAGEAHFDNVNGGGPATGHWCAAHSLTDDFEDADIAQAWAGSVSYGSCSMAEQGGQLILTHDGSEADRYCYLGSAAAFDLTDDAIAVEVPDVTTGETGFEASLVLAGQPGDVIWLALQQGANITAGYEVDYGEHSLTSIPYSSTDHRFWRIRESSGVIYWETSADGAAFAILHQQLSPMPITALEVRLTAASRATFAAPATVAFDNVNRQP